MLNRARREALLALAGMLAPGDKQVVARTRLAIDDPAAYEKKFARLLDDWNVDLPSRELPWIALIQALIAARRMASIDWKTSLEDLSWALGKLKSLPKKKWKGEDLKKRRTNELLEIFGKQLLDEEELVLGHLVMGNDAYQLVVAPQRDAARLMALARTARFGPIDLFTGSDLARFERERLADEKKQRQKRAREEAKIPPSQRQRQFIHPDGRVFVVWGGEWTADGKDYHAFNTVEHRLGGTGGDWWGGVKKEKVMSRAIGVRTRERAIVAHLKAGFEEVTREDWRARDEAVRKKKKR